MDPEVSATLYSVRGCAPHCSDNVCCQWATELSRKQRRPNGLMTTSANEKSQAVKPSHIHRCFAPNFVIRFISLAKAHIPLIHNTHISVFSDFSACSSDISGELERLATVFPSEHAVDGDREPEPGPELGEFLHGNNRDYLAGESSAAGAVKPLVELERKEAIVEEGGIAALEFVVDVQLCAHSVSNRGLLVRGWDSSSRGSLSLFELSTRNTCLLLPIPLAPSAKTFNAENPNVKAVSAETEFEKLMKAYDKKQVNKLCELFSFGGVLMATSADDDDESY
ncbi:hypothetical protein V8G54_009636 [Vigna mungo]|uniref:Uncharacterized protein n=1 Tax=Vigna mungo TaxID=3915 RepID=A0AAQ3S5P3_VIGMU